MREGSGTDIPIALHVNRSGLLFGNDDDRPSIVMDIRVRFPFDDTRQCLAGLELPRAAGSCNALRHPEKTIWNVILLAGQRPGTDPLAEHFGTGGKASIPINGKPMWTYVLKTLLATPQIGKIVILAQDRSMVSGPGTRGLIDSERVIFAESVGGIAHSISSVIGKSPLTWPVLITTADHPLLTPAMVSEFIEGVGTSDLAVAAVEQRTVMQCYPTSKRTWLKFRHGAFSGANLFALKTPATIKALELWSEAEQDRKQALKLFWHFGPVLALRALARTISFPAALHAAGRKLGVTASLVLLRQAEAAIDVDKISDHKQVESILRERAKAGNQGTAFSNGALEQVSIFDLDRTLTKKPTFTAVLAFISWRVAPWRLLTAPLVILAMLGYLCKFYSRKRVKEIEQWLLLGSGLTQSAIDREVGHFADRFEVSGLFDEGRATITRERATGHRVILATAANGFYAHALAKRLDIEEVIATPSLWKNGKLTSKIDGKNCYGSDKRKMVERYLQEQGLRRENLQIRFYSDHISDLPMLDWADEPIAVNPSIKLFEHALAQNWRIKFWV
jgi:HAD superfamily hydrolase (TIGR01490 family)